MRERVTLESFQEFVDRYNIFGRPFGYVNNVTMYRDCIKVEPRVLGGEFIDDLDLNQITFH